MNEIGFAITRASQGTGSVLTCNEGSWTSHITDIREYIKLFGATLDENRSIPFLTFTEEGCFLGIIRHIIGSVDDFFGGWLYIPRNISISGDELEKTLEYAKNVLTEENIHLKASEIRARFATTYPERYSSPYIPSGGERYGIRNPAGMSSMTEILEHRYQESYKGFRVIFLTDPVYVANEYKSKFGNFTNRKLEKSFIVIPPTDVSNFGDGTKLLVYNGEKYVHFSSPVRTKEGTPLRMSLKRPPFDSYRFTYNATKDNDVIDLQPLKFEWQVRVSRSRFQVYGDDHKPIVDAIIRIGNEVISGDLLVKESAAKNAEVLVSAVGYKETKIVLDLFNLDETVEINLIRNSANYTREILLTEGRTGILTIEAPGLNPATCPLEGYIPNEKGILTFDRLFTFKQRAIGFGAAIGLGAVIWLGIWGITSIFGGSDEEEVEDEETELVDGVDEGDEAIDEAEAEAEGEDEATDEEAEEEETSALSEEAMAILKKDVWKKSELDANEELEGLFDDLNHYRFGELTGEGKWAAAIKETHPDFAAFIANEFPREYANASFLPENTKDFSITIPNFKTNVLKAAERKKNGGKPASKPKADKPKADKPKADKPKADKPKADKPKTESKPKTTTAPASKDKPKVTTKPAAEPKAESKSSIKSADKASDKSSNKTDIKK